ncbi:hypothetical protein FRB94_001904 [Tulasnella sp. JGI-2019a]|nr:hypothetical protein FRB94_001904 [Tulasnella sp. JGI-2019a]KAG9031937.1 hypothetical protein FRB95_002073 [Tulasnella sp. JGI-2019a]
MSSRQSQMGAAPGRSAPSAQSLATRLLDKRAELEAVTNLDETTAEVVKVLVDLAKEGNIMADGGRAIAGVMINWPNVLRVIDLFVEGVAPLTTAGVEPQEPASTDLARLVRIDATGLAQN